MDPITLLSLMARTRTPTEPAEVLGEATADYCRRRLRTLTIVEVATAVVARAVAESGAPLTPVADIWWARARDPLFRTRSADLGVEMLSLAGRDDLELPRAVVIGMLAAEAGLAPGDLARMVAYDDVQGVLATAAVADATLVTASLFPDIIGLADRLAGLTRPLQIPDSGALLRELAESTA